MPVIDLTIIVLYLAAMLGVGVWSSRRTDGAEAFSTGGGRLPTWAIGLSIFATFFSSISFLALPGKAFASDWNPFVFSLSIPLAAWVAARRFVPYYRKHHLISAYSIFEEKFGTWARLYAVFCYLLTQLGRTATILYLLALPLAPLTGISVPTLIIAGGILVVVYTLIGGVEAVVWADAIQSVVFVAGAIFCLITILGAFPEGPGQAFRIASEGDKFSLGSFDLELDRPTFWVALLYGFFVNLQNFGIDQSYVQRYASASSEAAAKRSLWLGALIYPPVSVLFLLIGTALFALVKVKPEILGTAVMQPDEVLPAYMAGALPVGLLGLLVAALFAAGQSTVASSLNSSATILHRDIYLRFVRPDATDTEGLRVLRWGSALVGIAGTLAALVLAVNHVDSALDAWWKMQSIFSGGLLGLFLLSLVARHPRGGRAIAAATFGLLVIVWISLPNEFPQTSKWLPKLPLHSFLAIVCGTLAILLTGLLLPAPRYPKPASP